jgi:betaine-aldehyde dehydrogenase
MNIHAQPNSVTLPEHRDLFYGGGWHSPAKNKRMGTINPATGESLGEVGLGDAEDVDLAVKAAYRGFQTWRAMKPLERAKILREAAQLIRNHGRELALIDSANCGNPIREMVRDAEFGATSIEFFAGLATEIKGDTIPMGADALNYTLREPLGVVVRVNAYNHPFLFATMKIGAPLIAGNSIVVKPPEQAPLSTLRLAELIGPLFPPGVYNVICGGRDCGEALVKHPRVAKVALIGSVPTGKAILKTAADTMKKVTLELGGKNALIAFPDADPVDVASAAVRGMNFTWCGQSCGSTSRAFIHASIHDQVLDRIKAAVGAIKPGLPTDDATEMGCLVSKAQFDKVMGYIAAGQTDGATLVAGGKKPADPKLANGFYIEPAIFADVTPQMRIAREEIFGPVLSVLGFDQEEEAVRIANDSEYGLAAGIWTSNLARAHRVSAALRAGTVSVNVYGSDAPELTVPFGGYKGSGFGRDKSLHALEKYVQLKTVWMAVDSP